MHHHLTSIFIFTFLGFNIFGTVLGETSHSSEYSTPTITFQYYQAPTLSWNETSLRKHRYENSRFALSYQGRIGSQLNIKFTLYDDHSRYSLIDSSFTYKLENSAPSSIQLVTDYAFSNNRVRLDIKHANRGSGIRELGVHYTHYWKYFSLNSGIINQQSLQQLNIETLDADYSANAKLFQTNFVFGSNMSLNKLSIDLLYSRTIMEDQAQYSSQDIHTLLVPFLISKDLRTTYSFGDATELSLFYTDESDTLNASIAEANTTIGKIYALDYEFKKYGGSLNHRQAYFGISHHTLSGKFSASILASYFGDLLTQLSGARYYQIAEIDFAWTSLSYAHKMNFADRINVGFDNSLMFGRGDLYWRNHIFLFPNPISDLHIQEIEITRFVVDMLSLQLDVALSSKLKLVTSSTFYIPIAVETETAPQLDFEKNKASLSPEMKLRLDYSI